MSWYEVDGVRLAFERRGDRGPALVLVHGGMCDHRDWMLQLDDLGRDHRVIAPDMRCHGESGGAAEEFSVERTAEDLIALVSAEVVGPAVLVGHSFASRTVAEAARRRPDLVAGIVLLDGSRGEGGFAATEAAQIAEPPPASLREVLELTIGPWANAEIRSGVVEKMSSVSADVMAACVRAMSNWDSIRADLVFAGLSASLPMLAVQCTYHDKFTARRCRVEGDTTPYLDFLLSVRPDLEVAILPDTGHFAMLEQPERVNGLLRQFAARAMGER